MRKFSILLSLLLLMGCANNISFETIVDESLNKVNGLELPVSNNQKKKLLSYYLPQDIGVLESNNISSILTYNHHEIFMSINVSEVLSSDETVRLFNSADYEQVDTLEVSQSVELNRRNDKIVYGNVLIEKLPDKKYLIYVSVDDVFFVSSSEKADVGDVLDRILLLARSVDMNRKAVVAEFSNKESLTFEKNVIELFSESIPSEGMIKDIITNEEEGD